MVGAPSHPSHAGGNTCPASINLPRRMRGRLEGGAHVAGEVLVHQAGLPQHSGIGSAEIGGLRNGGQH